jgi:hypothetical protein
MFRESRIGRISAGIAIAIVQLLVAFSVSVETPRLHHLAVPHVCVELLRRLGPLQPQSHAKGSASAKLGIVGAHDRQQQVGPDIPIEFREYATDANDAIVSIIPAARVHDYVGFVPYVY